MAEPSPDQLAQQLLDLPPGEAEAILRRHAMRIPKETVKRLRQEQADMIYAALDEPEPDPVAWMYQGEPSFGGTDWRETWEVTTDKRLAEFKATPD